MDHISSLPPVSSSVAARVVTAVSFSSTSIAEGVVMTGATVWRVKVRVAIGAFENFPIPLMLVIVPWGLVASLLSENSVPSSVPASYGNRSTVCDASHSFWALSRDSPETPTNQSGLGAIIVIRVTRGWVGLTVMSTVTVAVAPTLPLRSMVLDASEPAALISDLSVLVPPTSAMLSIPALAVPPLLQKVALLLCTAPIKGEKCAPDGRPPGVMLVVHLPSNVTR